MVDSNMQSTVVKCHTVSSKNWRDDHPYDVFCVLGSELLADQRLTRPVVLAPCLMPRYLAPRVYALAEHKVCDDILPPQRIALGENS